MLFDTRLHQTRQDGGGRGWSVMPLLEEDLFLVQRAGAPRLPAEIAIAGLAEVPLILPTGPHGLRSTLDTAFAGAGISPRVVLEVDSLAMIMVVIDTDYESVTIYTRDIQLPNKFSVRELKTANKGSGPDVGEILKAYRIGMQPTI